MPEYNSLDEMADLALDDDLQLYKAHERIRALNRQLFMNDDAAVQIMALRKKVAESKEKAQSIIAMANKRITDLAKIWNDPMPQVEREAYRCSSSSFILRTAKGVDSFTSDPGDYTGVFASAVKALETMSSSSVLPGESKKESARLAEDLRMFLNKLQKWDFERYFAEKEKLDDPTYSKQKEKKLIEASTPPSAGSRQEPAKAGNKRRTSPKAASVPVKTPPSKPEANPSKPTTTKQSTKPEKPTDVQKKPDASTPPPTNKFKELKKALVALQSTDTEKNNTKPKVADGSSHGSVSAGSSSSHDM